LGGGGDWVYRPSVKEKKPGGCDNSLPDAFPLKKRPTVPFSTLRREWTYTTRWERERGYGQEPTQVGNREEEDEEPVVKNR